MASRRVPPAPQPLPQRRLAAVQDGASYAGVSTKTIRRWIANGVLPGYRMGPRLLKVDLNDLDALARRIPTAGDAA